MGYFETDDNFVDEWAEKWCSLFDLLYETLRTDKFPSVPYQPGITEEIRYQSLRSWFIENEAQFLPIWKKYYQSQDWTLDVNQDIIDEINNTDSLENPSLAFCMPESLDKLLHYVSGSGERYPTEEQAWAAAMDLLRLSTIGVAFFTTFMNNETE